MAVIVFSVVTWKQTGYWKDSVSLFSHALEVTENNFVAHANLGTALRKNGENDQAIIHFRGSLDIRPNQPDVYMILGLALDEQGNGEKALVCLQKSVLLDPEYYHAQYNLGTFLFQKNRVDLAIPHLEKAVTLKPGNAEETVTMIIKTGFVVNFELISAREKIIKLVNTAAIEAKKTILVDEIG